MMAIQPWPNMMSTMLQEGGSISTISFNIFLDGIFRLSDVVIVFPLSTFVNNRF